MNTESAILEEWFREYQDAVLSFLVYRLRTRDVDDLVQETFLRALRGMSNFRGNSEPLTWLLAIARSVVADHTRRTRRAIEFERELRHVTLQHGSTPEDVVNQRETYQQLMMTIASLRKNQRDVVVLRDLLHLSAKQAGTVLDWPPSRVNVTLHRAHEAMRSRLKTEELGGIVDAQA